MHPVFTSTGCLFCRRLLLQSLGPVCRGTSDDGVHARGSRISTRIHDEHHSALLGTTRKLPFAGIGGAPRTRRRGGLNGMQSRLLSKTCGECGEPIFACSRVASGLPDYNEVFLSLSCFVFCNWPSRNIWMSLPANEMGWLFVRLAFAQLFTLVAHSRNESARSLLHSVMSRSAI